MIKLRIFMRIFIVALKLNVKRNRQNARKKKHTELSIIFKVQSLLQQYNIIREAIFFNYIFNFIYF